MESSSGNSGEGGLPVEKADEFDSDVSIAAFHDLLGRGTDRRSFLETLSRLPREITGYRILGKSVGDLAKEAAVSGAAGALFRIGLGSAGVGGIALGATVGAGVAGIMEIRRQAIENQRAHPERTALKEKLKSLNPHDKKKLVMAIGRGAVFGAAGGIIGGYLSETGFGEAVKGVFSRVGELKDAVMREEEVVLVNGVDLQTPVLAEAPTSTPSPAGEGRPGAVDILGGAFHNVGLKIHETTGWGLPSGESAPTGAETPPVLVTGGSRFGPIDAVGGLLHNIGLKAHEVTGLGVDAGKTFVDHSKYFVGRMEITDSSPEWIKSINSLDGTYAKAVQGTVGEYWPQLEEEALGITNGIIEQNLSLPRNPVAVSNHILHILEDKANRAFDSHLQSLVNQGIDLNTITDEKFEEMIEKTGRDTFEQWLQTDSTKDITAGAQKLLEIQFQINQLVDKPEIAVNRIVPAGTSFFEAIFPGDIDVNNTEHLKRVIPDMAAHDAANYVELQRGNLGWTGVTGDHPFPAYPGEILYLMRLSEGGDLSALYRLRDALRGIPPQEVQIEVLTDEGKKKVLELLKQLG